MSTPDPAKVKKAEEELNKAMNEINDLTAKNNAGPVNQQTLQSGLQALKTAITGVPTHK